MDAFGLMSYKMYILKVLKIQGNVSISSGVLLVRKLGVLLSITVLFGLLFMFSSESLKYFGYSIWCSSALVVGNQSVVTLGEQQLCLNAEASYLSINYCPNIRNSCHLIAKVN